MRTPRVCDQQYPKYLHRTDNKKYVTSELMSFNLSSVKKFNNL